MAAASLNVEVARYETANFSCRWARVSVNRARLSRGACVRALSVNNLSVNGEAPFWWYEQCRPRSLRAPCSCQYRVPKDGRCGLAFANAHAMSASCKGRKRINTKLGGETPATLVRKVRVHRRKRPWKRRKKRSRATATCRNQCVSTKFPSS